MILLISTKMNLRYLCVFNFYKKIAMEINKDCALLLAPLIYHLLLNQYESASKDPRLVSNNFPQDLRTCVQ